MTLMKQKLKKGDLENEILLHQVKKIKFNTSFNVTINLSLHWVNMCRGKWRQRGHRGQWDLCAFPSFSKFDLVKIKQNKKRFFLPFLVPLSSEVLPEITEYHRLWHQAQKHNSWKSITLVQRNPLSSGFQVLAELRRWSSPPGEKTVKKWKNSFSLSKTWCAP